MNFTKIRFLIVAAILGVASCLPQSTREIAAATKLTEQNYYNSDVKFGLHKVAFTWDLFVRLLQAPNLIPFDNPNDIDNVKEEYEGYGSKIDSVYDGLHKKSSVIFNVSCETFFSPIIVDWRFFFSFFTAPAGRWRAERGRKIWKQRRSSLGTHLRCRFGDVGRVESCEQDRRCELR